MTKPRYPKYKSSHIEWIGDIPEDWEIKRMKNMFHRNKNIVGDTSGDYKVLALTLKGVIERDLENNFGKFPKSFDGYQIVEPNSLIVCLFDIDVTPRIIGYVNTTGIMTSAYTNFGANEKEFCMKYYYYYVLRMNIENILLHFSKSLRSTIVSGDFLCIEGIIPPLAEQQSIATYLDDKTTKIDQAIGLKKNQIKLLKEKRVAMINQAVTKGLDADVEMVDSGIDWIGEIPKGWEVRKLRRLFDMIGSGTTPTAGATEYYENGIFKWLNTGDLNDGEINNVPKSITQKAFDKFSLRIYPAGSLIIAMYGATIGKLGILGIGACTNQACCVIGKPNNIDIKFMFYRMLGLRKEIISLGYGGGQPNISQDTVKQIRLPVPDIKQQRIIIDYLDHETALIDGTIAIVQHSIDLLVEYKQSLISHVVTGKVKVF